MAKHATKALATSNTAKLNLTHPITLTIHLLYHILRLTLFSATRSLTPYLLLTLPSLFIEAYLEYIGRPHYNPQDGTLKRPGDDLNAPGLMEYMWDIVYWSWINIVLVLGLGDRAWWLWLAVPAYSVYLVGTTIGGVRSMLGGMGGAGAEGQVAEDGGGGTSNRQKKMAKKGGRQKATYS